MLGDSIYDDQEDFNPFADVVSPLANPKEPESNTSSTHEESDRQLTTIPEASPRAHRVLSRKQNLNPVHLENLTLESSPLGPLQPDISSTDPIIGETKHESSIITSHETPDHSKPQSIKETEQKLHDVEESSLNSKSNNQNKAPEAPLPHYEITIHDPHKVGELTSAHTVYCVTSTVTYPNAQSPTESKEELQVERRYRDFLLLYQLLGATHPGTIIPPAPEKQVVGRFDDEFVELRRASLEKMIRKIAQHPRLCQDDAFRYFLSASVFDLRLSRRHGTAESRALSSSGSGILGSISSVFSGSTAKYAETDEFLEEKKLYWEVMDAQLRSLYQTLSLVMEQRDEVGTVVSEFGESLANLSLVELDAGLCSKLDALAQLQMNLHQVHERRVVHDNLTLSVTLNEYIRTAESVQNAYASRQKVWQSWQSAIAEANRSKATLDKYMKHGKTQQEKITNYTNEVNEHQRVASLLEADYANATKVLKSELGKIEEERVEEFKASVETWLESIIESQKEIIDRWETFLQQQQQQV
ncbi:retromer complex subunit Vps5 [Schizosaccharomyces japonicus yFS275]|uniref:Retromer complex subunit Vps5 n=1 Tax=Schizosaccharomyces japonicus (strain yFS275 / FY16936) TaxID=402676 RepID=B6K6E5_SCHJY|nr:retromer complex subunit Vps5 [Schizosaccharomyces japonicus yFS275]EEB09099.1 retromer complex subunit Vps5 [Schizosaccharomyces japonicus yFS275]